MRRSGKKPDIDLDSRPKTTARGIAVLIGASRQTLYRRIREGKLNLEGIPCTETRTGKFYDMQAVFEAFFPKADSNAISIMMYDFRTRYGRHVR